ncbi:MAG TPA: glutaredoxin family protein [Trebonia sp.]|nr:glutaredoxin family protein [Trebonia sp.]
MVAVPAGPRVGVAVTTPRITLLGRPGCHLCDAARTVISRVADDLGVAWEERDITQSPADLQEYWEKIPVTLVDGVQHDFWRVSEDRLRKALCNPAAGGPQQPSVSSDVRAELG